MDYFALFEPIDGFVSSKPFTELQELLIGAAVLVYIALIARRSATVHATAPGGSHAAD